MPVGVLLGIFHEIRVEIRPKFVDILPKIPWVTFEEVLLLSLSEAHSEIVPGVTCLNVTPRIHPEVRT